MTTPPSIARELANLLAAMPSTGATVAETAAWLRRKAALYRRIVAESDDPSVTADAARMAATAEQRARELEAE
jgi:hypothetical protein